MTEINDDDLLELVKTTEADERSECAYEKQNYWCLPELW